MKTDQLKLSNLNNRKRKIENNNKKKPQKLVGQFQNNLASMSSKYQKERRKSVGLKIYSKK